jgi:hypothetical protein
MTTTDRRGLLLGLGSAALLGATAPAEAGQPLWPMSAAGTAATLRPAPLDDATLMHTFMKLRGATDGRLTIGWMDAVNYAFIDGETWPMYRLLAATWQTFRKVSDTLYESRSLEVAHFLDLQTGALLQKLTMPVSGAVVDVPAYRAGPSVGKVALRLDETRDFRMASEGKDGASFFRTGKALASQLVSQPEREGGLFSVREDLNTRILPATPGERGFFYREWTIWKGPWKALVESVGAQRADRGDLLGGHRLAPVDEDGQRPGQHAAERPRRESGTARGPAPATAAADDASPPGPGPRRRRRAGRLRP